jgi:hypothetical protein
MIAQDELPIRRSLLNWRITAGVAFLLLAASILWSVYAALDAGVSLAYRDDELNNVQRAQTLLEAVVLRVSPSTTRSELIQLLRDLNAEPFEKEGGVHAEGLSFYFASNGGLACITSEYPPEETRCAQFATPGTLY